MVKSPTGIRPLTLNNCCTIHQQSIQYMNQESFDDLTEAEQKVVTDAANEVMMAQFKAAKEQDEHYVKEAEKAGMKYFELSDEQIKEFAQAAREKVWPLMDQEIGSEIMNTIRANATPL